jgi:hypothetical protein
MDDEARGTDDNRHCPGYYIERSPWKEIMEGQVYPGWMEKGQRASPRRKGRRRLAGYFCALT